MTLTRQELIINNDDFAATLEECFGEEYEIGIHGIENSECWIKKDGEWKLNKKKIEEIKNTILNEGINIEGNRTLLSTVRFSELEDYLTRGYYDAGGIIIALPKTLKNSSGEQFFVGSPKEQDVKDRNYALTSLCDMILPEYKENSGHLNHMFVLAKYEKIAEDKIRLTMNPKHIYYNNGLLPNEYFKLKKKELMDIYNFYGASDLDELITKTYDILIKKENISHAESAIIGTINQYNEKNKNRNK